MHQSYSGLIVQRKTKLAGQALAAALLGLSLGGCSYQMGLYDKEAKAEATGSVAQPIGHTTPKPADSDLVRAKQAATDLLARNAKDASQTWENPATGATGTVTPMAAAYADNGTECRDFLASYVQGEAQTWFQGDACKTGRRWEVRNFKPLRRT